MGFRMISPGVYQSDPEYPSDDFAKYSRLVEYAGIPPNYRHKRLYTFEEVEGREEGFRAACDFIKGEIDPPILLLFGEPGRSKTHLAVAIAWCFIAELKVVAYYHVTDLLDNLRTGIRIEREIMPGELNPHTITAIMQKCRTAGLLVLDDIGEENPTDFAQEKMDSVVNYRYEHALPTVITSNTLEISGRIRDRCREGRIVQLEGRSYRAILSDRKGGKNA